MKIEFKIISNIVLPNSRMLDVGCGDGILMEYLKAKKNIDVRGLEINEEQVKICLSKGLSVIEGNAETELAQFPDKSFDYVVLSQTLQAFMFPKQVLKQLLRIGKQAVISIPNFGYWKVRINLLLKGTMPVTNALPNKWYDTPNLHMCSIKDFYELCIEEKISINKSIAVTKEKTSKITEKNLNSKNFFSELGIFLIQ